MSRIFGTTDEHIDIGSLLEQLSCRQRSSVLLIIPLLEGFVVCKIVLCVDKHLVEGDDTLRHKIDAVYGRNRRYVRVRGVGAYLDLFTEIICGYACGSTAADNMLSLFCKKQSHHSSAVIFAGRRADCDIKRLALYDFQNTNRCIVKGPAAV